MHCELVLIACTKCVEITIRVLGPKKVKLHLDKLLVTKSLHHCHQMSHIHLIRETKKPQAH